MDESNPDWIRIYTTTELHKAEIVKAVLEDNQVQAFEMNKKDSSYIFMGEVDLYVHQNDAVLAAFLIKSNEL
jgi:hypothetical protein